MNPCSRNPSHCPTFFFVSFSQLYRTSTSSFCIELVFPAPSNWITLVQTGSWLSSITTLLKVEMLEQRSRLALSLNTGTKTQTGHKCCLWCFRYCIYITYLGSLKAKCSQACRQLFRQGLPSLPDGAFLPVFTIILEAVAAYKMIVTFPSFITTSLMKIWNN